MNFVSYEQMTRDAVTLARQLPRNTQGVLGIPRSGMMVAAIVAQELDCHLGDVSSYAQGRGFTRPGRRMGRKTEGPIVLIDDSHYAGQAMSGAMAELGLNPALRFQGDVRTAALYVLPGNEDRVWYHVRAIPAPRLFAWNWRSHDLMENALFDLDGVICMDPDAKDDGGEAYGADLVGLLPLWLPQRRIKGVVTGRLEKWREGHTKPWLYDHGVQYGELVMGPWATVQERKEYGAARWKAEVYAASDASLFVESCIISAGQIFHATQRPVFCPTEGRLFDELPF